MLGGTQSLHTNGRDEALALPTEEAARIALADAADHRHRVWRRQHGRSVRAGRTTSSSSPTRSKPGARTLLDRIDALGGTLAAIESGDIQRQIQEAAYRAQIAVDAGEAVVVGVNRYATDEPDTIEVFNLDPALEQAQVARVQSVRARRDESSWKAALGAVAAAAAGTENLVPRIIAAVEARATVGEIADTLRAGVRRVSRSRDRMKPVRRRESVRVRDSSGILTL